MQWELKKETRKLQHDTWKNNVLKNKKNTPLRIVL